MPELLAYVTHPALFPSLPASLPSQHWSEEFLGLTRHSLVFIKVRSAGAVAPGNGVGV